MEADATRAVTSASPVVGPTRLWFGLLGGAIAWSLRLVVGYAMVPTVCDTGRTELLHAVTVVFAAATTALVVAWGTWRRATPGPELTDRPDTERRVRFMGIGGVLLNGMFLLAGLVEGATVLLHDPCLIPMGEPPRASLGLVAVIATWLGPAPAAAHHGEGLTGDGLGWAMLALDPWVLGPLVLTAAAYARGARRLRRRGGACALPGWRIAAYAGALGALLVALVSPLDALAAELFSAHMVQHLLLMLVAAPLLALAGPVPALLWGLPLAARQGLGRWWARTRWVSCRVANPEPSCRGVAAPRRGPLDLAPAGALRSRPRASRSPRPRAPDLLRRSAPVLVGAGPRRRDARLRLRRGRPLRLRRVDPGRSARRAPDPRRRGVVPGPRGRRGALGSHAPRGPALAGVIMWAPAGLAYVAAGLALFAAWLRTAERAAERRERPWVAAAVE